MNARERFLAVTHFEKPDRLPIMEHLGYWPETVERWEQEGLEPGTDLTEYFGYDPFGWVNVDFNFVPPFEVEVIREDDETQVVRDVTGVLKQEFKHGSAMPHYIDFPIKTREDFLALKERLKPDSPDRYPADWDKKVAAWQNRDYPLAVVARGLLAFLRDFMDFQDMSMTFLTDPNWVAEMMDFHTDFLLRLWDKLLTDVDVDMIQIGEDMAYKTGPMISPDLVRHFMVPRYKKLTDFWKSKGVDIIFVDSDGDVRSLIPLYLEGGVRVSFPWKTTQAATLWALARSIPGCR